MYHKLNPRCCNHIELLSRVFVVSTSQKFCGHNHWIWLHQLHATTISSLLDISHSENRRKHTTFPAIFFFFFFFCVFPILKVELNLFLVLIDSCQSCNDRISLCMVYIWLKWSVENLDQHWIYIQSEYLIFLVIKKNVPAKEISFTNWRDHYICRQLFDKDNRQDWIEHQLGLCQRWTNCILGEGAGGYPDKTGLRTLVIEAICPTYQSSAQSAWKCLNKKLKNIIRLSFDLINFKIRNEKENVNRK